MALIEKGDTKMVLVKFKDDNTPVECDFCGIEFRNQTAKFDHRERCNSGCWEHRMCFPQDEHREHAESHKHRTCFVPWCKSAYKDDLDWTDKEICVHVINEHTE